MHPLQKRALAYIERKGTRATWAEIREKARETLLQVEGLIAGLDSETAARQPAKGGWTVHEVVDHLVESHRPGVQHLRSLLQGRRPADEPVPASLQSSRPFSQKWADLSRQLSEIHRDYFALLDGAPEALPDVTGPIAMVLKVPSADGPPELLEWTQELGAKAQALCLRIHTHEHLDQIRRIVEEVD